MAAFALGLGHLLAAAGQALLVVVVVGFLLSEGSGGGPMEVALVGLVFSVPVIGDVVVGLGLTLASLHARRGGAPGVLVLALLVASGLDLLRAPLSMLFLGMACLTVPLYVGFAVAELVGAVVVVARRPSVS